MKNDRLPFCLNHFKIYIAFLPAAQKAADQMFPGSRVLQTATRHQDEQSRHLGDERPCCEMTAAAEKTDGEGKSRVNAATWKPR